MRASYGIENTSTDQQEQDRLKAIARAWGHANLDHIAIPGLGGLLAFLALLTALGVIGATVSPGWIVSHAAYAITLGTLALAAITLRLIQVGRNAYRDAELRRKVGILWDLATFWPRAAHPLAPPCYMERALADLLTRINDGPAQRSRPILLSTHSQGTVIGAALLMSLEASISSRVAFLTYGSPLRRLYAIFFPAYFSAYALARLGQFLSDRGWTEDTPFDDSAETRTTWRWHNLYRSSDPIGGPVFAGY